MKGFLRRFRKRSSGRRSEHSSAGRGGGQKLGIETLESRTMLAVDPLLLPTVTFTVSIGDTTGDLVVETLPHLAPTTVENFANYIEDGDYLTSLFHRLDKVPGRQVLQGGLLTSPTQEFTDEDQFDFVPTDAPIPNEPDAVLRPNVRGAIGMARTSNPDSATSGFYFNTQDNPGFDEPLAPVGFTVFGNLTSDSLAVLDMIALLDVLPEAPFGLPDVPFADTNAGTRNLVRFEEISASGTIHGVKFNDRDGDGTQDTGEEGLAGVTIFVDINGNSVLDGPDMVTQTNDEGRYAFALDLEDGEAQTFIVREADDPGMVQTAPDTGFHVVLVRPGLDTDNIDFGNQLLPVVEIEASDPAASETGTDPG
ncbi:MAG: peptidylprolyl isomerase, partial [Planctomycetota bacterium]|nr:peptidylprolyl isomerase [Planctomycetota bacterium]